MGIKKKSFFMRGVKQLNRLPRKVVAVLSLGVFMGKLEGEWKGTWNG